MTELLDLEVGPVAHGGFCIARLDGRVLFVRHALPGERVRARVTEDGGSYLRADAVEIVEASPDRVPAPCPHAGPGRCGGCDWQHVAPARQRELKADVVREQFHRLAGIDLELASVEELPGGALGWRTRVLFAVGRDGTVGLRRHRSHEIEPVTHCPLAVAAVADAPDALDVPPGASGVELACGDDRTRVATLAHRPGPGRQARGRRPPDRVEVVAGPPRLTHRVGPHQLEVDARGFWQVHPDALATFSAALLDGLALQPGESVLELYSGSGALTSVLADAVGAAGRVVGIESSKQAVADAAANLDGRPWARVERGRVDPRAVADARADVVVLDPPRAGAGAATMRAILATGARVIGYVACDPASLARDVATALEHDWQLSGLRAFDAFPMTHHVECVAILEPRRGVFQGR